MPLLRKPVLLPDKGRDHSVPAALLDDRYGFSENMEARQGEIVKRPGKSLYGPAAASASSILGYKVLELNSLSKFLVRATKSKIESFNPSSGGWASISVSDLAGGDDDLVNFTVVSESGLLLSTNRLDAIRKWTGAGFMSDLGGSPPKASYITYISPYILLADVDDGISRNPWKVQWPDTGYPEIWTGGNSGAVVLGSEPSPIKNIARIDEFVAVYKKNSLWIGRKVDTADVFRFDMQKSGIGLAASRAFTDVNGIHYFMSTNDFYIWNGGSQVQSIGKAIRDKVFAELDYSKIGRCFAFHARGKKEVWFFVVTAGNSWPTVVWRYRYDTGNWYMDTCSEITAAIIWQRTSSTSWDDDSGTWDDDPGVWDEGTETKDSDELILGDSSGRSLKVDPSTYNDLGTAIKAVYETIDFFANKFEYNERWLEFHFWAKGPGTLRIYYSIDYGDTWINIPYTSSKNSFTLSDIYVKYEAYLDVVSSKIRFKFIEESADKTLWLRYFMPFWVEREQTRGATR